jgi:hypothetical protein
MIGNEPTEKILVNIPQSVKRKLKYRAIDEGVTLSALVNRFLADSLNLKQVEPVDSGILRVVALLNKHKRITRAKLLRNAHLTATELNAIISRLQASGSVSVEHVNGGCVGRMGTVYLTL